MTVRFDYQTVQGDADAYIVIYPTTASTAMRVEDAEKEREPREARQKSVDADRIGVAMIASPLSRYR